MLTTLFDISLIVFLLFGDITWKVVYCCPSSKHAVLYLS